MLIDKKIMIVGVFLLTIHLTFAFARHTIPKNILNVLYFSVKLNREKHLISCGFTPTS